MGPIDFPEQRLRGRCAIVTGGGAGIGRAYAHRLAAEGAAVVIAELDGAAGEVVAKEITDAGGAAHAVQTDVGDESSVRAMLSTAMQVYDRVDVLVNNAAMFLRVAVAHADPEDLDIVEFERVLHVNVTGTWLCCKFVVPVMRAQSYGKIINISSGTVFKGSGGNMLQYVTSKSAILGFTRSLARTVGPDGIRVNCVAPGFTIADESTSAEELDVALQRARRERALPRIQHPDDLVGVVSFLSSADSDFITGQTIVVDGGAYMH